MAVLAQFGYEDARAAPVRLGKFIGRPPRLVQSRAGSVLGTIDTRNGAHDRLVPLKDFFQGVGDFPERGPRPRGLDGQREQIPLAAGGALRERLQRALRQRIVTLRLDFAQPLDLRVAHGGVIDFQHIELLRFFEAEEIDANNGLLAGVNAGLAPRRGLLDAQLGQAGLDGFGHAAEGFDFAEVDARAVQQRLRERFDIKRTGPGINHSANARLLLQ